MRIKEFLPNPAGKDSEGEYIAIQNEGNAPASLDGWRLRDASGKQFMIRGITLAPLESYEFPSSLTKISLNNSGETITLFDPQGNMVDELEYEGTAREEWLVQRTLELIPELKAALVEPLTLQKPILTSTAVSAALLPAMALVGVASAILAYQMVKRYGDPET